MRITVMGALLALAGGAAAADEVGVPAGCAVTATLVKPDCEMHQVLACEAAGPTRVDVYKDGVFLGEEAYAATTRVRWRRGNLLQELEVLDGGFDAVPAMPAEDVVEVATRRVRKQLGSDMAPMTEEFDYRIEALGPAMRRLDDGGAREVRRYRVTTRSPSHEASDVTVDYDPALGLPIWVTGEVVAHDGSPREITLGTAAVLMPGEPGYMSDTAPDGAACPPS
ncbi:hypothetical protein P1J78_22915 [Psychromarinibacter sp. C21-152]|uniref:Uncharacterized protein n=1 Tax=Psychromarinibacter sediminicola TaxID=3033385 RepID=A0AAE3NX45_9RHOB|nr:hypothetical protein [Psychromarinibacter sediminicola]MDF0603586.1 hypothetical protein [Psychromarinibacter sediminicola]